MNNTRKMIRLYLMFSLILWVATAVCIAVSGALYHNNLAAGTLIFGLFMCIFTLTVNFGMTYAGLDRIWFKTVEELRELQAKEKKSWEEANKMTRIIGNHEAVKMWKHREENKRYYKGNEYIAWTTCKMKHPITRDWVDAIIYKRTDGEGGYFVREESDFNLKFKTAPSEVEEEDVNKRNIRVVKH